MNSIYKCVEKIELIIETERLIIRRSIFEDCVRFAQMETSEGVRAGFTMNRDWDYNKIAPDFVKKSMDESVEQWTIILKESGEIVGRIVVTCINRDYDSLDITRIYIGEDELRGKGLGSEALEAMLKHYFLDENFERISLDYLTGNPVESLYRELGFRYECKAVHAGKKDGVYKDLHRLAMIKSEYLKRCGNA